MTWRASDALPKPQRGRKAPAPVPAPQTLDRDGFRVVVPESALPQEPDAIPTYAAMEAYLEYDEDAPMRLDRETERELAALGVWPAREWDCWRMALTRDIVPI